MDRKFEKSVFYLMLGMSMYPFLYMVLNLAIPILMAILGDRGSGVIDLLKYFTWFIMPLFSVFYLLAFHHFSILLGKWHRLIGYILIALSALMEVTIPWLETGFVSKAVSFLCPLFEVGVLLGCLFTLSVNFKLSIEHRKDA